MNGSKAKLLAKLLSVSPNEDNRKRVPLVLIWKRRQIMRIFIVSTLILIVLSVLTKISTFVLGHGNLLGLIPKFDMDKEANIPTLFNTFLLAFSGVIFFIQSDSKKYSDSLNEQKPLFILGMIFSYMALDEITGLHELLINPLREVFDFSGAFHFSWVVVGLLVVALFLGYFIPFFLKKPRMVQTGLFLAGFLYIGGVLGIEMIGGAYASTYGELNLTYGIITTLEESFELFGLIVLINTLLKELIQHQCLASLRIDISE
jgi:magnesium-transporting ATPase (P-type)